MKRKKYLLVPGEIPKLQQEIKGPCESWSSSTWKGHFKALEAHHNAIRLRNKKGVALKDKPCNHYV